MEFNKSRKIYNNHNDLVLTAREENSFKIFKKAFPGKKILIAPDIVLCLNRKKRGIIRENILVCLRSDKESNIDYKKRIELLVGLRNIFGEYLVIRDYNREYELENMLDMFRKSKLVVTDRLHVMIFCAITATSSEE
jgi:pyruvyl transferase EpsI